MTFLSVRSLFRLKKRPRGIASAGGQSTITTSAGTLHLQFGGEDVRVD
jgi:hypothetical protein